MHSVIYRLRRQEAKANLQFDLQIRESYKDSMQLSQPKQPNDNRNKNRVFFLIRATLDSHDNWIQIK